MHDLVTTAAAEQPPSEARADTSAATCQLVPSVRRNVILLLAAQVAAYVVPLVTLPWIARALGVDQFGRLGFAMAVVAYCATFTEFGFNLSATRRVAVYRNDAVETSTVFWATVAARSVLALAALVVVLVLVAALPQFRSCAALILLGYVGVVGSAVSPAWYFQGVERLTAFTAVTVVIRLVTVPLTLILVRSPRDVDAAIAVQACGVALPAFAGLALLRVERSVRATVPSWSRIVDALKDAWPLFLSVAAVTLYTTANTILLRVAVDTTAVAYFVAAERLVRAAQALILPFTAAVFPRVSHLVRHRPAEAHALVRTALLIQGALTLAGSAVLLFASPIVIRAVYGPLYAGAVGPLAWLAFLPFVIALSNVFGIQVMVPLGHERALSRILLGAGVLNITVFPLLAHAFGASGAAASVLLAEVAVTSATGVFVARQCPAVFRFDRKPAERAEKAPVVS